LALAEIDLESDPIIVLGKVLDTKDELQLGRVQVQVEGFGATLTMPWLRIVNLAASPLFGSFWLPEVGDEVLVLKGAGNQPDGMFILGSLYNGVNKPLKPDADGKNDFKQFVTRGGSEITFTDTSGKEFITIATKEKKLSIVFDQEKGEVTITGDAAINVIATDKVSVTAKTIELSGSDAITIAGGKNTFSIKGDATVNIEGKQVNVKGDAVMLG